MIDYEKPGRFQLPSNQEKLKDLVQQIIEILILNKKQSSAYFKSGGIITQRMGVKKYSDKKITYLEKLCLDKNFQNYSIKDQYQLITETIAEIKPSFVKKSLVNQSKNVSDFINAIKEKDKNLLEKIKDEIKKENNMQEFTFVDFLSNPLKRENCLFKKDQAIAAANWWLNILKTDVPEIIALLNDTEETPITFSPEQERIFITTLADSIWEACQDPLQNVQGQSPLYVFYKDKLVQDALQKAQIKIIGDEKLERGLGTFIRQDGEVSFENLNEKREIYPKAKKKLEKLIPIEKLIPEDNIIQYRDTLSTIVTGKSKDPSQFNLCALPKDVMADILLYAKPDGLEIEKAKKQIAWNQARLISAQSFFRAKTPEKQLLKIELSVNPHAKCKV